MPIYFFDHPDENYNVPPTESIPGCHVSVHIQTRTTYTKVLNFFRLLFTVQLGDSRATHTNSYAWAYISKKKSYANKEGAWSETNPKEIMNFIALLVYQGSVKVSSHAPYWSTKLNHYTMAFGLENLCPEIDMPQF